MLRGLRGGDFAVAVAAAMEYLKAFWTEGALKDVVQAFAGGRGNLDQNAWRRQS